MKDNKRPKNGPKMGVWRVFVRGRTRTAPVAMRVQIAISTLVITFKLLAVAPSGLDEVARGAGEAKLRDETARAQVEGAEPATQAQVDEKEAFVVELLKMLHEQYGSGASERAGGQPEGEMQERRSYGGGARVEARARMLPALLEAIGAEGDMRRLIDWIKDSFNPSSIPEVTTQFVVSKLGSVNCPALLRPDKEESLIPRFLLFNDHHVDVPFELPIRPSAAECLANAKFDPARKTIVIIHGFLGGYTLIDGLTNIKNRLLDLNRFVGEHAMGAFIRASQAANSSAYVFTDDLSAKIRAQLYNVIIVDWFNGANPAPRANYIRAAVNAQVVGKLIARFLSALVVQCGAPAEQLQIIAHSLGCHVSGFTGKAMNAAGHRLGKITHLDPVGLCFGRLFSQPRLRLSPGDALETQAVHVSLNIFDNPLDGAHSNFLLNGGRDQPGCGNQNEVKNSTGSSVALLFDPAARFAPCSHLRALALFEDDHSSRPGECQFVGYRCPNYERFLAGKCGFCDATNSQCRLMGLPAMALKLRTMTLDNYHYDSNPLVEPLSKHFATYSWRELQSMSSEREREFHDFARSSSNSSSGATTSVHNASLAQPNTTKRPAKSMRLQPASSRPPALTQTTLMYGQPAYLVASNQLSRRSERRLAIEKRERISHAIERLRSDTRLALSSLRQTPLPAEQSESEAGSGEHESAKEMADNELEEESTSTGAHSGSSDSSSSSGSSSGTQPTGAPNSPTTTTSTTKPSVSAEPDVPSGALEAGERLHEELVDQTPLGGQPIPADSLNGPLFFLGTSSMSPFCVNYYQVRVHISESRLLRIMSQNGLASNRLKAQYNLEAGSILRAAVNLPQRSAQASGRDMLHLTVKLTDSLGHFFKGFSLLESARSLARVINDFVAPPSLALAPGQQAVPGLNEPMLELTMLLNSTRAQPTKVAESIISYYFHPIVLADRVEINYMSNISPDIRAQYSSVLCPVAINDRHQLVKYVECHKVSRRRRRK